MFNLCSSCCIMLMAFSLSSFCADTPALRVAVAQPMVVPGDVDGNIHRMSLHIAEASSRGADAVVFSEAAITGFDLKGVGAKAAFSLDSKPFSQVVELARKYRITIIAGFFEKLEDKVHNSAGIFFPDGSHAIQRKNNVMDNEKQSCATVPAERKRTLFDINGFKCAILICADAGIPGIYDEVAAEKCDSVFLITAGAGDESSGFRQSELAQPERLQKYLKTALACIGPESVSTSLRLQISQVNCNQSGWRPESGFFHPGGSCIIDHTGETSVVIPPRFVLEHVKADIAVGTITRRKK